ncbi:MAG: methyltransferase domain-containing protein [Gammaproteobacteria bacterium]|nr:methyltransferase domain-containing protein [Gammaproteobacteria bacterium]
MKLSRLFRGKKPKETVSYIDTESTVAAAQSAGLSITAFREREAYDETGDERFLGRRDRVYRRLARSLQGRDVTTILEIGPGAGAFTEEFATHYPDADYQIYEPRHDWTNYLVEKFSVRPMPVDGSTLTPTTDGSVDLVHCHATFVYIPPMHSLGYIQECCRVLRPGGLLMFDVYTEDEFDHARAARTIAAKHRFHTIIPRQLLLKFLEAGGLTLIDEFHEQHTLTADSRYYVLEKQAAPVA